MTKKIKVYPWTFRNRQEVNQLFEQIGVDNQAWDLMNDKTKSKCLLIDQLSMAGSNVLKQTALSQGAEAAVHGGIINGTASHSKVLLSGTPVQLRKIAEKIKIQQFNLKQTSQQIIEILDDQDKIYQWNLGGYQIKLDHPVIVGILNLTPDSFYDGGKHNQADQAVEYALNMAEQGADIIDIGGESSRPGSTPLDPGQEQQRILPVIEKLKNQITIPLSVDTRNPQTADFACSLGCSIINDISGVENPAMIEIIKKYSTGVVVMHKQGNPQTMQNNPFYQNPYVEITDYLEQRISYLKSHHIPTEQIVADPGFGFGKNLQHNLNILNHLGDMQKYLHRPVFVGISRKSMIKLLGGGELAEQRLPASLGLSVLSLIQGIRIFRTHDVEETRTCLQTVFNATGGKLWM
ncbi:MAG: dihydropteroate synthase [bacterium]